MLTEIRLENFKCFKGPVSIPLKPLSVFIGPNGTGKSTPIQALLLLKQSLERGDLITSGPYVWAGSLKDLVTAVLNTQSAKIGFSGSRVIKPPDDGIEPEGRLEFDYNLSFTEGRFSSHDGKFKQGNWQILVTCDSSGNQRIEPQQHSIRQPGSNNSRQWHFTPQWRVAEPAAVGGTSGTSGDYSTKYDAYFQEVLQEPKRTLENIKLVSAIRGFDEPFYQIQRQKSQDVFSTPPSLRSSNLATNLSMDRATTDGRLSDWLRRVTGVAVRTRLAEGLRTEVESVTPLGEINMIQEGLGSNQLTWLLYSLAVAATDSLLAIEEPEIHLHPGAQAKLADIFVEAVTQEKKQLVLTTHSEHILLRLLTAVAQGRLSVDDLAVNYFQKDGAGFASVTPLEIDDKGRVKGGLPGFFEADLENLDAFVKAMSKGE